MYLPDVDFIPNTIIKVMDPNETETKGGSLDPLEHLRVIGPLGTGTSSVYEVEVVIMTRNVDKRVSYRYTANDWQ